MADYERLKKNQLIRSIIDAINNPLILIDEGKRIILYNKMFSDLAKIERENTDLNCSLINILNSDEKGCPIESFNIGESKQIKVVRKIRSDEYDKWYEILHIITEYDLTNRLILVIFKDITSIKKKAKVFEDIMNLCSSSNEILKVMDEYIENEKLMENMDLDCIMIISSFGLKRIYGRYKDSAEELFNLIEDAARRSIEGFSWKYKGEILHFKVITRRFSNGEYISIGFKESTKDINEIRECELEILKIILELISLFLYTENRFRKLEMDIEKYKEKAFHDPLTGAYTRHFFNEWMMNHSAYLERVNGSTSFVMIDIDNMKGINDEYGHIFGDGIIRDVARILDRSSRSMDLVIRYGGDEFLLVFPETGASSAKKIVDRIEESLKSYSENLGVKVSISYGIAETRGYDYEESLNLADLRMYRMKQRRKIK